MGRRWDRDSQIWVGRDGWSDWIQPSMESHFNACCDCSLVHEYRFRIIGDKIEFKVRADRRSTAAFRRKKK